MVFLHLDLILYFLKIGLKGTESEVSCQSEKLPDVPALKLPPSKISYIFNSDHLILKRWSSHPQRHKVNKANLLTNITIRSEMKTHPPGCHEIKDVRGLTRFPECQAHKMKRTNCVWTLTRKPIYWNKWLPTEELELKKMGKGRKYVLREFVPEISCWQVDIGNIIWQIGVDQMSHCKTWLSRE